MTTKQRAYLKSLASTMDPIFQVGKAGAAPELVNALDDALEKRELVKINVLNNCADDLRDIAEVIASRTHSQVVQVIGRRIVLYRPSKKPQIQLPR